MQSIFERHENKYLISKEQCVRCQKIISQQMEPDSYCQYMVQNIYYDNEAWDVIRTSIEKPKYKEKMRLRCYDIPNKESKVFLELKKKYKGIVYKRRAAIPFNDLSFRSTGDIISVQNSQIFRELNFYMTKNQVMEKIYIAYRRTAFTGIEEKDLRVTFDADIRFRLDKLDFLNPELGIFLLPKDIFVMEIKALGGMPLWMARFLCENEIFPTPFSKYGKCYTGFIIKQQEINRKELLSA